MPFGPYRDSSNKKGGGNVGRTKDDSIEAMLEKIARAVWQAYGWDGDSETKPKYDMGVVYTFDDAVITKDYNDGKLYEISYNFVGEDVVLVGEPKEVESVYILKRLTDQKPDISLKQGRELLEGMMNAVKNRGAELTGPIIFKNDAQRIAFAAVLVPGEPDLDYNKGEKILTEEEVERVANQWLADYSNIDLLHSLNNVAVPVQSYTTYSERTVKVGDDDLILPKGTWILGSRIGDDAVWEKVQKGELTGYSIMGIKKAALKNLLGALKSGEADFNASLKKTLLKDLGDEWIAPFVSLVDSPCVPKSKFFVLKSEAPENPVEPENTDEKPGAWIRFLKSLAGLSDTVLAPAKKSTKGKEADDMTSEEIKELVSGTMAGVVEEALKSVKEQLKELKESFKQAPAEPTEPTEPKPAPEASPDPKLEGTAPEENPDANEELEAFKTEISSRLDELGKKLGVGSSALKGQDGKGNDEDASPKYERIPRDLHGRRLRNVDSK